VTKVGRSNYPVFTKYGYIKMRQKFGLTKKTHLS